VVSEVSQTKNFLDLFRHLIFLEKVEDSNQTTIVPFEDFLFLSLFFPLGRSAKFCIVSFLHVCLDGYKLEKKVLQNFLSLISLALIFVRKGTCFAFFFWMQSECFQEEEILLFL
jgi:hypothetical protein